MPADSPGTNAGTQFERWRTLATLLDACLEAAVHPSAMRPSPERLPEPVFGIRCRRTGAIFREPPHTTVRPLARFEIPSRLPDGCYHVIPVPRIDRGRYATRQRIGIANQKFFETLRLNRVNRR